MSTTITRGVRKHQPEDVGQLSPTHSIRKMVVGAHRFENLFQSEESWLRVSVYLRVVKDGNGDHARRPVEDMAVVGGGDRITAGPTGCVA